MRKLLLLLLACITSNSSKCSEPSPHVILCTYYTESHKELAHKWLLPSIKDDFELIIGKGKQHCQSATYLEKGWTSTTRNKVQFIINIIKRNMGSIIIFADADVVLMRPIKKELCSLLETYEFAAQIDNPGKLCSGFFALSANEKTLQLWQEVLQYMKNDSRISDQRALNHFLNPRKNPFNISWTFLPETYFGGGTFKKAFWGPGKYLHIPEKPAMFHANYTKFKYKDEMLTHVTKHISLRKQFRRYTCAW